MKDRWHLATARGIWHRPAIIVAALAICALLIRPANVCGQVALDTGRITFSVDVSSPLAGALGTSTDPPLDSFFQLEIDGADILTPGHTYDGNFPPGPNTPFSGGTESFDTPGTVVFGIDPDITRSRRLGLSAQSVGANREPEAELDALSFGRDIGNAFLFSVDEVSTGSVGGVADQAARGEAAADVFRSLGGTGKNSLVIDGGGLDAPYRILGLGLREASTPVDETPQIGDRLDALDFNTTSADLAGPIYFSVNTTFGEPSDNTDAPDAPMFRDADILVVTDLEGGGPEVYLAAEQLGLGIDDDVDALALYDHERDNIFDPSHDEIFFSVRRGSPVIGIADSSALNLPIQPGDILTIPFDENMAPRIVVRAEDLGLSTSRFAPALAGTTSDLAMAGSDGAMAADIDAIDRIRQDGNMNCENGLDPGDVPAFIFALEDADEYTNDLTLCGESPVIHGDINLNNEFGFEDIEGFVAIMLEAGTIDAQQAQALLGVPEPSSAWLAAFGCLSGLSFRRVRRRAGECNARS